MLKHYLKTLQSERNRQTVAWTQKLKNHRTREMAFAVKSTSCSFRKPGFNFQHLHDVLWNHLQLQSQGSNALFWPLQTVRTHGALTYTHRTYKKVSFPFPSFLLWLFFKGKNELQSFLAALIQGVKTLRRNYLSAQNGKKRYFFFFKKWAGEENDPRDE